MLTTARRVDRHYAFDGWMIELQEVPLQAVTYPFTQAQIYPPGATPFFPYANSISQFFPNAVTVSPGK